MQLTKLESLTKDILCAMLQGPKAAALNVTNDGDDFVLYAMALALGVINRCANMKIEEPAAQPITNAAQNAQSSASGDPAAAGA